jgi:hypothetical protein
MRVWFRWDPRVCCVNSQGVCVSMCGLMRTVDGARLATLHNTHEPACARKQFEKIRPATRIVALSGQIASGRLEWRKHSPQACHIENADPYTQLCRLYMFPVAAPTRIQRAGFWNIFNSLETVLRNYHNFLTWWWWIWPPHSYSRLSATLISDMWRRREIDVGLAPVPAELGTRMLHSLRCLDI